MSNFAESLDFNDNADEVYELLKFGENTIEENIPTTINITWSQLFKNIVSELWKLFLAIPAVIYLKIKADLKNG